MDHFERAKDKIMMGAERKSMVMKDDEKRLTAYHEAGHAIVGRLVPGMTRFTRSASFLGVGRWASPCSCPRRIATATASQQNSPWKASSPVSLAAASLKS